MRSTFTQLLIKRSVGGGERRQAGLVVVSLSLQHGLKTATRFDVSDEGVHLSDSIFASLCKGVLMFLQIRAAVSAPGIEIQTSSAGRSLSLTDKFVSRAKRLKWFQKSLADGLFVRLPRISHSKLRLTVRV